MASVLTPIGTLSFPSLFTPKPRFQGGDAVYQATLIFDAAAIGSPEYAQLKKAVADAISAKWGPEKLKDTAFMKKLRLPFRDGAEKDIEGYGEGKVFINAWTKQKPGVVDENVNEITIASDVYAGQPARATVVPFAYSQQGNMGVSFSLEHVQIADRNADRMDGRKSAKQAFGQLGSASGAGVADENIPF